jgi:hypothetical protein
MSESDVTVALEPQDAPDFPLTADRVSALLSKDIA